MCSLLSSTNKVGSPGEYLLPKHDDELANDAEAYKSYVQDCLTAHASSNGVSGVKMMEANFLKMLSKLRSLDTAASKSDLEVLRDTFPQVKFVFITRANKFRQGTSLARAEQTNRWEKRRNLSSVSKLKKFQITPTYIQAAVRRVCDREQIWKNFFEENQINPHIITYENLASSQLSHICETLKFLQIENAEQATINYSTLKKQSDIRTEILILYYQIYFSTKSALPDAAWRLIQTTKNRFLNKVFS